MPFSPLCAPHFLLACFVALGFVKLNVEKLITVQGLEFWRLQSHTAVGKCSTSDLALTTGQIENSRFPSLKISCQIPNVAGGEHRRQHFNATALTHLALRQTTEDWRSLTLFLYRMSALGLVAHLLRQIWLGQLGTYGGILKISII